MYKQKIEVEITLARAFQVLWKRVPRGPGERPSYDCIIRWLMQTHPALQDIVVEELTLS